MGNTGKIPPEILAKLNATNPVFVEKTAIANVWRVESKHGLAALKIYHKPTMGEEANGFTFIDALNGGPVVKIYKTTKNIALMEWLDGPALGDMTRGGSDSAATAILVGVANRIHFRTKVLKLDLTPLDDWFSWLLTLKFAPECPADARKNMMFCQNLATELLASQTDIRPLHGDLHHDNIRLGARGYTAFDAKGLVGERAFELANAFRNPKGADAIIADPQRVNMLLDMWSTSFGVDRQRLLQWATVKIALSISWRCNGVLAQDDELPLLAMFVRLGTVG